MARDANIFFSALLGKASMPITSCSFPRIHCVQCDTPVQNPCTFRLVRSDSAAVLQRNATGPFRDTHNGHTKCAALLFTFVAMMLLARLTENQLWGKVTPLSLIEQPPKFIRSGSVVLYNIEGLATT